jgi:hypothetical protein
MKVINFLRDLLRKVLHGSRKLLKKDPKISLTMDLNNESMEKKKLRTI